MDLEEKDLHPWFFFSFSEGQINRGNRDGKLEDVIKGPRRWEQGGTFLRPTRRESDR